MPVLLGRVPLTDCDVKDPSAAGVIGGENSTVFDEFDARAFTTAPGSHPVPDRTTEQDWDEVGHDPDALRVGNVIERVIAPETGPSGAS